MTLHSRNLELTALLAAQAANAVLDSEDGRQTPVHVLIGSRPALTSTRRPPRRSEPRFTDTSGYLDVVVAYTQACRRAQHSLGDTHQPWRLGGFAAYPAAHAALFMSLYGDTDEDGRAALSGYFGHHLDSVMVTGLFFDGDTGLTLTSDPELQARSDARLVVATNPDHQERASRAVAEIALPLIAEFWRMTSGFTLKYGLEG